MMETDLAYWPDVIGSGGMAERIAFRHTQVRRPRSGLVEQTRAANAEILIQYPDGSSQAVRFE